MKKMIIYWKLFCFSVGAQLNAILISMIVLFAVYSLYSNYFFNQFNLQYQKEINQYYGILTLKQKLEQGNLLFAEYVNTGNRTSLAEFNDYYHEIEAEIKRISNEHINEEAMYLITGIEHSFNSYYVECCNTAFLLSSSDLRYYDRFYDSQTIAGYLEKYTNELLQRVLESSMDTNDELVRRRGRMLMVNMAAIGASVALLAAFALFINLRVTRPLNELKNQADEITKGNLDAHVRESKSENTVSVLSRTFNQMADGIKENIEKEKQLLTEQKKNAEYRNLLNEARFLALQSQTNPHFLFNTLNSISSTITLGRGEKALGMLDSLAVLFRYNLEDAGQPVWLGDEISITEEYVSIQKQRFADRMTAEIRRNREIEQLVKLPRFTLQPLVENAIIHGLEPKEEDGRIVVDMIQIKAMARIRIYDNGAGMGKEKLKELCQEKQSRRSRQIGVWNIRERMKLFTATDDSIKIYSKRNMGTMVILYLPIKAYEGEESGI